tara:strand:+ start:294 stop:515 length:222 start_codon:yes stop_codon:yes gene_type:complete
MANERELNKYIKQLTGSDLKKEVFLTEEELIAFLPSLTKTEIELVGRKYGIEVDRRKAKTTLIEQVTSAINGK